MKCARVFDDMAKLNTTWLINMPERKYHDDDEVSDPIHVCRTVDYDEFGNAFLTIPDTSGGILKISSIAQDIEYVSRHIFCPYFSPLSGYEQYLNNHYSHRYEDASANHIPRNHENCEEISRILAMIMPAPTLQIGGYHIIDMSVNLRIWTFRVLIPGWYPPWSAHHHRLDIATGSTGPIYADVIVNGRRGASASWLWNKKEKKYFYHHWVQASFCDSDKDIKHMWEKGHFQYNDRGEFMRSMYVSVVLRPGRFGSTFPVNRIPAAAEYQGQGALFANQRTGVSSQNIVSCHPMCIRGPRYPNTWSDCHGPKIRIPKDFNAPSNVLHYSISNHVSSHQLPWASMNPFQTGCQLGESRATEFARQQLGLDQGLSAIWWDNASPPSPMLRLSPIVRGGPEEGTYATTTRPMSTDRIFQCIAREAVRKYDKRRKPWRFGDIETGVESRDPDIEEARVRYDLPSDVPSPNLFPIPEHLTHNQKQFLLMRQGAECRKSIKELVKVHEKIIAITGETFPETAKTQVCQNCKDLETLSARSR